MKSDNLPKLSDRTIFEKVLFALQIILSVSVIILVILELTNRYEYKNGMSQLFLGLMFFVIFLQYRKYNTIQAYINLAVSIIIIAVFVLEVFFKV